MNFPVPSRSYLSDFEAYVGNYIDKFTRFWNDHNQGKLVWDNVTATTASIGALTSTTSTVLKGTTTNDSAAAGNIGEFISATGSAVSATSSNQYQDTITISLTAGDWDVSGVWQPQRSSSTWSFIEFGISAGTAGNTFSDSVDGDNRGDSDLVATLNNYTFVIPPWRVSLATTTTVRLKTFYTYSAGTPVTGGCRLSARRVR